MRRSPAALEQGQQGGEKEEQLVQAWEGPMEQAAASLLGARRKVCCNKSIDRLVLSIRSYT